ncbi:unnamed protein product [Linum trigynum]|uniref:Uncharacterized protein n=1 Tax=Linum trigynum TaxID=586398 RepID=A0AAV2E5N7_9ROSI
MDVMFAHQQSSLNLNAPMFVPMAYQAVEDFSKQWWSFIQSSTWFRDYWFLERYQDPQSDFFLPDDLDFLDDGADFLRFSGGKEKAAKIVNVKMSPRTIQQPT